HGREDLGRRVVEHVAPGPGGLELQSVGEVAGELGLQTVVVGVPVRFKRYHGTRKAGIQVSGHVTVNALIQVGDARRTAFRWALHRVRQRVEDRLTRSRQVAVRANRARLVQTGLDWQVNALGTYVANFQGVLVAEHVLYAEVPALG